MAISNKNTNITIEINEKTVDSKTVSALIRSNCSNATPRMFAREITTDIFEISKTMDIPRNLALRLERNFISDWKKIQSPDKQYWAADFQSGNTNCPEDIRNLLRKNYEETFQKTNKKE